MVPVRSCGLTYLGDLRDDLSFEVRNEEVIAGKLDVAVRSSGTIAPTFHLSTRDDLVFRAAETHDRQIDHFFRAAPRIREPEVGAQRGLGQGSQLRIAQDFGRRAA